MPFLPFQHLLNWLCSHLLRCAQCGVPVTKTNHASVNHTRMSQAIVHPLQNYLKMIAEGAKFYQIIVSTQYTRGSSIFLDNWNTNAQICLQVCEINYKYCLKFRQLSSLASICYDFDGVRAQLLAYIAYKTSSIATNAVNRINPLTLKKVNKQSFVPHATLKNVKAYVLRMTIEEANFKGKSPLLVRQ